MQKTEAPQKCGGFRFCVCVRVPLRHSCRVYLRPPFRIRHGGCPSPGGCPPPRVFRAHGGSNAGTVGARERLGRGKRTNHA